MRTSRLLSAGLVILVGCQSEDPTPPTGPSPSFVQAPCSLAVTDPAAEALLTELLSEVASLRATGGLTSGQANALRKHVEAAQRKLTDDDYCGVIEKLANLRTQLTRMVTDGDLTQSEADPLFEGIRTMLEGILDQLAFESFRDGAGEIYRMNHDGSGLVNLSNNAGLDMAHAWSRDGTRLAFSRDGALYVMNADGTGLTGLATGYEVIGPPAWSPDGTMIAVPLRSGSSSGIHRVPVSGGTPLLLTAGETFDTEPKWSPDGTKIVFVSFRDVDEAIYVVNADGSNETQLTNTETTNRVPSWSPDGTKILWNHLVIINPDSSNAEIFTMNPDGSGKTNLTNSEIHEIMPSWSHDGSKIVYVGRVDGVLRSTVYSMNADGSGQTPLSTTGQPALDEVPLWSPDAARIVFTRRSGGSANYEIWVMRADGSGITNISNNAANDFNPSWRPR